MQPAGRGAKRKAHLSKSVGGGRRASGKDGASVGGQHSCLHCPQAGTWGYSRTIRLSWEKSEKVAPSGLLL